MKIVSVQPGSIAAELGIRPGDDLLELNDSRVQDGMDLRFREQEAHLQARVAQAGGVVLFDIEKGEGESLGMELEEMKVLSCGNDCIFCFVDQNPPRLRKSLFVRDGDYRLSFMYGNYTTLTNAGPAVLRRIVEQRLSPQYISVHTTDPDLRRRLMGLKKDDGVLEKIRYLHDHGIEMHTQIVLCPGFNDGEALLGTIRDLYAFRTAVRSLAVVPVGLTDHRAHLEELRRVDAEMASRVLDQIVPLQKQFRRETGRGFVYASDEFYILAGRPLPGRRHYDGYPQVENGVGLTRSFLERLRRSERFFPNGLPEPRRLLVLTGELAAGILEKHLMSRLKRIQNLTSVLVVAPNILFGRSVTVSGLLSGGCIRAALRRHAADLVLLPPEILNAENRLLDDISVAELEGETGMRMQVFGNRWREVFSALRTQGLAAQSHTRLRKEDAACVQA
ncbi:MAG: DUF512 domain-containing protein [Bacteroidota bacterium]